MQSTKDSRVLKVRPIWSRSEWPGRLPEALHEALATDRYIPLLLACQNDRIIGWAYTQDRSNQLESIFIDESFRRQGKGRRLFRCLSRLVLDYGCSRIQFESKLLATKASQSFFHSIGADAFLPGAEQSILGLHAWMSVTQLQLLESNQQLGIADDYGICRALVLQIDASELTDIGEDCWQRPQRMATEAAAAWSMMRHHAEIDNIKLLPVSAYRSTSYQTMLLQKKLDQGQSIEQVLQVSAAPGFSEHHSGRAIDITDEASNALEEKFAETAAYRWLNNNASDYGFTLSYPLGNPHRIAWEPWHWCWSPE